jgi:hypothetical protein
MVGILSSVNNTKLASELFYGWNRHNVQLRVVLYCSLSYFFL